MTATATFAKQTTISPAVWRVALTGIGLVILAALAIPLLTASPGPLTSDESLYVSEGLNIAEGKGFTYTTGEPVHHRGPVFPALLAADFSVRGFSIEGAYAIPKLFALGSALLLLAIGWRFFGREAGFLAAAFALASALLNQLGGTSLFLDGTQTFFLLAALLLIHPALKDGRPLYAGLAGAALGLAMLTKESALLWIPLPFLAVLLLGPAVTHPGRLLAAYSAGFLAVAGWWWPYSYAVTGEIYLLGSSWTAVFWLGASILAVAGVASFTITFAQRGGPLRPGGTGRWLLVGALLFAWGALFILGLERNSAWDFPPHYVTNVPDYVTGTLASWVQPLPLIAIGWIYVGYRAYRGSLGDRLLLLGLLLFLPFAIFVANRALSVRDMLPLVYLSYMALGRTAVDFARYLADALREGPLPRFGNAVAAIAILAAFAWYAIEEGQRFAAEQANFNAAAVRESNWHNPLAIETAAWIEKNIPPGTPIMSGRLYSTHIYTLTGAAYPLWQLPTVRVDIEERPLGISRQRTLFRWEDHSMPAGVAEPWLYLRRYPIKGYYVALSERDLIAGLNEHKIEYIVLTGDDAGFSSLSLLPYFEKHPYFTHKESFIADDTNQTHIFQVAGSFEEPTNPPALVNSATVESLEAKLGPDRAAELLKNLSPGGYATSSAYAAIRPPQTSVEE